MLLTIIQDPHRLVVCSTLRWCAIGACLCQQYYDHGEQTAQHPFPFENLSPHRLSETELMVREPGNVSRRARDGWAVCARLRL